MKGLDYRLNQTFQSISQCINAEPAELSVLSQVQHETENEWEIYLFPPYKKEERPQESNVKHLYEMASQQIPNNILQIACLCWGQGIKEMVEVNQWRMVYPAGLCRRQRQLVEKGKGYTPMKILAHKAGQGRAGNVQKTRISVDRGSIPTVGNKQMM